MDKEKQIEEMYKDCNTLGRFEKLFNELIKAGYRKITENEVVISKEEYETLTDIKALQLQVKDCLNNMSNEDIKQIEAQARKETAEKILKKGKEYYDSKEDKGLAFNLFAMWIEKEFGVDLGETK